MAFTLELWKEQGTEKLHQIGEWLDRRKTQDAPYLVYGTLCGLGLWPLVEAAQTNPFWMLALGSVAAGVGSNLIANQIQNWKDQADQVNEADVRQWVIEQAPANSELRQALDEVLKKLDAVSVAQASLPAADRQWFMDTLRAELAELNNQTGYFSTAGLVPGLQVSAFVARQKVNVLMLERVSNLLLAGEPSLIQTPRDEWVWQVPVDLTFPSHGRVGRVGEIEVEARYGEVRYSEALLAQMNDEAERLAQQVLHPS